MRLLGSLALAACLLAAGAEALGAQPGGGAGAGAMTLRYRAFDSRGKALLGSSLESRGQGGESLFVYRKDGGYEQRVALKGDERRLYARYLRPGDGRAFSAIFSPAEGRVLAKSESPWLKGWKPSLRDGDESLFFILPRLIDLRAGASKTYMTVVRAEDGMSATFVFECLGIERILVNGEAMDAYDVRMRPADLLLRVLWPYSNRYYFRADDLVMVRFEGPDAERRMGRIELQSAEPSPSAGS
jgi:hypothetical protein